MSAIIFIAANERADAWEARLKERIPDLDFRIYPENVGNPEDITFAIAWNAPPGTYKQFPNLKTIYSLGQGVDHLFRDPDIPEDVNILRIVDPWMSQAMSEWVMLQVLRFHRQGPEYEALARKKEWKVLPFPETDKRRVGVMGMGALGSDAASKLAWLGFDVAGWSRSEKQVENVKSYFGADQLNDFLARTDILVALLPLTPQTENMIDASVFAGLPKGAFFVNSGRGLQVVEEDLIAALDSGWLAGASLDVFRTEPLPQDDPLWDHPKVQVWPHVSAQTNPESAADQVAENYRRVQAGEPLLNRVDPVAQY